MTEEEIITIGMDEIDENEASNAGRALAAKRWQRPKPPVAIRRKAIFNLMPRFPDFAPLANRIAMVKDMGITHVMQLFDPSVPQEDIARFISGVKAQGLTCGFGLDFPQGDIPPEERLPRLGAWGGLDTKLEFFATLPEDDRPDEVMLVDEPHETMASGDVTTMWNQAMNMLLTEYIVGFAGGLEKGYPWPTGYGGRAALSGLRVRIRNGVRVFEEERMVREHSVSSQIIPDENKKDTSIQVFAQLGGTYHIPTIAELERMVAIATDPAIEALHLLSDIGFQMGIGLVSGQTPTLLLNDPGAAAWRAFVKELSWS